LKDEVAKRPNGRGPKVGTGYRFNFSFGVHHVLEIVKIKPEPPLMAVWMTGEMRCPNCKETSPSYSTHILQEAAICVPDKEWGRLLKEVGPPVKDSAMIVVWTADGKILRVDGSLKNGDQVRTVVFEQAELYKELV